MEMDPKRRRRLGEQLTQGTINLGDSDRPENQILAGLRMIGGIEQRGEGEGMWFTFIKKFTTLLARSRMWTPEQVEEAIEEGRRIERDRTAS